MRTLSTLLPLLLLAAIADAQAPARGGVIVVRVTDEAGRPRANVEVHAFTRSSEDAPNRLRPVTNGSQIERSARLVPTKTDDRGEYRLYNLPPGQYWVKAQEDGAQISETSDPPDGRMLMYPPTFYPGTTQIRDAEPVLLEVGQERRIDIMLVPWRTAHVSGHVIAADGTPARGYVVLQTMDGTGVEEAQYSTALTEGEFRFSNVPPGEYVITKPSVATEGFTQRDFGSLPITVAGENLTNLVITTVASGSLSGRIVFDGDPPPRDADRSDFTLETLGPENSRRSWADPEADWSFTLESIEEPVTLQLSGRAGLEDWLLEEVTLASADVTDTPLRNAEGLIVVLTQRFGKVEGAVIDKRGTMVSGCRVLVFAEDPAHWISSNRLGSGMTDARGRFGPIRLLPGRYLVVAGHASEIPTRPDADALNRLKGRATALTVGERESKSIQLTATFR
jgi:hypothetical protein